MIQNSKADSELLPWNADGNPQVLRGEPAAPTVDALGLWKIRRVESGAAMDFIRDEVRRSRE